ncbi:MAG: hypothetical protein IKL27_01510, partial [Oscillospiraceae bacterium]|nr:hypothetical protein [Oscillospiraceae bacterium]
LGLTISGGNAGLHLLLSGNDEVIARILAKADAEEIRVPTLSDSFHSYEGKIDTLIFGYAGMSNEDISSAINLLFYGI